jgi:hypothetical protein
MATYSKQDIENWLSGLTLHEVLGPHDMDMARATLDTFYPPAAPPPPAGQLSPHFNLAELTYSETAIARGINNDPGLEEIMELEDLANETLEKIRAICNGKSVLISSGFRCTALNNAIGGASNSAHLYGCAADITIPQFGSPLDVCKAVQPHVKELGIDQLIYETNSSGGVWVHVGRVSVGEPRGQCFSIVKGVTQYSPFPG